MRSEESGELEFPELAAVDADAAVPGLSILHVIAPGLSGGREEVVRALAIGQQQQGNAVHVLTILDEDSPEGMDHPFLAPLRAEGIRVLPVRLPPRAYLLERAATAQACQRLQPDLVHTHGYRPDVLATGVARRMGIPAVTTVHGFTGGDWKNRLYERLQCWSFRAHSAVVAVSKPLAQDLVGSGIPADRVHVLPNAWRNGSLLLDRDEARRQLGIATDRAVIGWVGRLSPEKGADVLLDALAELRDVPVEVHVLGDGRSRAELQAQAQALGVADRVTWRGLVPQAARYFRAFDLLVLSSRTEGTPITLLEGMYAGTPIVATRVGGVPDVVSAAEAVLVPPEQPQALANAIRDALADPHGTRTRALAARDRLSSEFAFEPWIRRYQDVYHNVLRASPRLQT